MSDRIWWKEQVIYQIYPRSFMDSNGDGIGDLPGIYTKLDYLSELGVDIIWMSPIYASPNDDNGYDISDYRAIHPDFGTMGDFDDLLDGLHQRGMKLIMDLVVNHSSDEHHWFQKSRQSKDNPYRDYYFWRPGVDGGPPNNWQSFFGGSAWQLDELTGEYYLHYFTTKQPDLNWENKNVREEVIDILRYWLEKGVDGFRMDVISLISKPQALSDSPYSSLSDNIDHVYANGPKVHEYLQEIYDSVLSQYDIMTVGEGPGITKEISLDYVGKNRRELNMIFHLDHMFLGHGPLGKFDPVPFNWDDIKRIFGEWDQAMGDTGWLSIFLDNHDFPRMVSRFGNDGQYRVESAKLLAMLVLTLRGTACIYQGSEIGMTNVKFDRLKDYRDVETLNFFREFEARGMDEASFIKIVHSQGRDNVRTPIQWNDQINGGFTTDTPWINTNPNFNEINVEHALNDSNSIFYWYKNLLQFRRNNKTLVYGQYAVINQSSNDVFVYERFDEAGHFIVVLNHCDKHNRFSLPTNDFVLQLQNVENPSMEVLQPWEARLYSRPMYSRLQS